MKAKINNFLLKIKEKLSNSFSLFKKKVSDSYYKCKKGDETLKNILLYWSFIPCTLYLYISYKFYLFRLIRSIINIFMLFFTVLCFYFIQKAVKVHPEYDSEVTEELEKAEYYSTLTEEEYKKAIKTDSFNKKKNFIKRILNIGNSKKVDLYKIVRIFVVLTFLVALKRIIF